MRYISAVFIGLLGFAIIYLMFAFISDSFNIAYWQFIDRAACAFLGLFAFGVLCGLQFSGALKSNNP